MILSVSPGCAGTPQTQEHGRARGLGSWAEMSAHRPKDKAGMEGLRLGVLWRVPEELRAKDSHPTTGAMEERCLP